jgi:PKD repeat protein
MKNISLDRSVIVVTVLLMTTIIGCKKTATINIQQPTACFLPIVYDRFNNRQWPDTSAYRDFYYYFKNCSDSGENISYRWSFGDGTTSTERSPKHIYPGRGVYQVSLIVASQNRAFDSSLQTVIVISGQRHINLGDNSNVVPIAIEETPANEFLLLATDWYSRSFFLFELDSMLRQKHMMSFPASYNLSAMQAAIDGNFILTGSTKDVDKGNEIIKIKPDGSLIWSKTLSAKDVYRFAAPSLEGGYYIVGSRPIADINGNPINYTIVIKTNSLGEQLWEKLFDQENMLFARNAVVENDGIVLAGIKPNENGPCFECDSSLVLKLNNDGNLVWKNISFWGLNSTNSFSTQIVKLINGNYVAINENTTGLIIISNSGNFLDRKLAPYPISSVIGSNDGSIVNLMSWYGNGSIMYTNKMTLGGVELWNSYADGRVKTPDGYSCCSSSWPVVIRPLRNGGTLSAGYRVDDKINNFGSHLVTVLQPLDEEGKLK